MSATALACTVRGCGLPLADEGRALRCPAGHSFDVAKSGYVNLLQPQDRRSLAAGDAREAVAARARLERRGLERGLAERVAALARALGVPEGGRAADVGCGTGALAAALAEGLGVEAFGVDLSAAACDHAARCFGGQGGARFLVANADRRLPFADASLELATTVRGPKSAAELARVLRPGAALVVAVPGPEDLLELRARLGGEARLEDRVPAALAAFAAGFEPVARDAVRARTTLDRAGLEDLLRATYRGARRAERERLAELEQLEITTSSDLLAFRRVTRLRP